MGEDLFPVLRLLHHQCCAPDRLHLEPTSRVRLEVLYFDSYTQEQRGLNH